MTFAVSNVYVHRNEEQEFNSAARIPTASILITIALIIFIGCRPLHAVFVDMLNYDGWFYYIKNNTNFFSIDWNPKDIIFTNFMSWCSITFNTPNEFFFIVALIYFSGIFIACRRMFPGNTLAALLVYLGALSTFSYSVNGIKAGVAASIFLVALTFYNRKWLMLLFAIISLGIHHSMQLCLFGLILALLYDNPKFYFGIWVICFFIALFHITVFQELFAGLTDEQGAEYLSIINDNTDKGVGGFRIDFILYGFAPIAMGVYAIFICDFKSKFYNFLLSLYLIVNAIWLLCIYANFTNRIAYLSWFLLPFVLIYPLLHPKFGERRYHIFIIVMLVHLGFTLFMNFIYANA